MCVCVCGICVGVCGMCLCVWYVCVSVCVCVCVSSVCLGQRQVSGRRPYNYKARDKLSDPCVGGTDCRVSPPPLLLSVHAWSRAAGAGRRGGVTVGGGGGGWRAPLDGLTSGHGELCGGNGALLTIQEHACTYTPRTGTRTHARTRVHVYARPTQARMIARTRVAHTHIAHTRTHT